MFADATTGGARKAPETKHQKPSHLHAAPDKLLPGENPILVCVQPVEDHLHLVPQLLGTHIQAGEGGGHH